MWTTLAQLNSSEFKMFSNLSPGQVLQHQFQLTRNDVGNTARPKRGIDIAMLPVIAWQCVLKREIDTAVLPVIA